LVLSKPHLRQAQKRWAILHKKIKQKFKKMKRVILITTVLLMTLSLQIFAQKKPVPGGGSIQPSDTLYGRKFQNKNHWTSQGPYLQFPHKKIKKTRASNPLIGASLDALSTQGITSDNSIAISNKPHRQVVNLDITHVEFNNEALTNPTTTDYYSWVNGSAIGLPSTGQFFDPRVIYDPQFDRFIAAVLWDENTYNSKLFILSSNDGDPNNGWAVFSIDASNGEWFDYTQLGMSTEDIFIPLNMYNSAGTTLQAVDIYQIPKSDIYSLVSSTPLNYAKIDDVKDVTDTKRLIVCPVTNGEPVWNGSSNYYGDGCFLVGYGVNGSNSQFSVYDLMHNFSQYNGTTIIPTIIVYASSYPAAIPLANVTDQLGTGIQLQTNDQRITSAYYLDKSMIFSLQGADIITNDYSLIYLFRLEIATLLASGTRIPPITLGVNAEYYNAPFICHNGTSLADRSTSLVFSASSAIDYPYLVTCNIDDALTISNIVKVRPGDNFIDNTVSSTTNPIRWVDYNSIHPLFDDPCPRNYLSGTFGEIGNNYCANYAETVCWPNSIKEVSKPIFTIYPNPATNYLTISNEQEIINSIQLFDITGKEIIMQKPFAKDIKLNLNNITDGNYILKIKTENGTIYNTKIVVNN
jgi:hypothetical protein